MSHGIAWTGRTAHGGRQATYRGTLVLPAAGHWARTGPHPDGGGRPGGRGVPAPLSTRDPYADHRQRHHGQGALVAPFPSQWNVAIHRGLTAQAGYVEDQRAYPLPDAHHA